MSKNLAHFLIKFLAIYLFYVSIKSIPLQATFSFVEFLKKSSWVKPNYSEYILCVLQFAFVAFLWFKTDVILAKIKGLQAEKTKLTDWKKLSQMIVFLFGLYLMIFITPMGLYYIVGYIYTVVELSQSQPVFDVPFIIHLFITFIQLAMTIAAMYICLFKGDMLVALIARQAEKRDTT